MEWSVGVVLMVKVDVEEILAVATMIVVVGVVAGRFNGNVVCLLGGGWMIDQQRNVRRVVLIKRLSGQGRRRIRSGHGTNPFVQMTTVRPHSA
jgi:hypothetical protein